MEHYHELKPKFSVSINSNQKPKKRLFSIFRAKILTKPPKLVISLHCTTCEYTSSFITDYEVDVISIDDKPYFVPIDFFVYSPVELDDTSVKPSVEYVKLKSGLYVPKGYISDNTMKKLTELDEEYERLSTQIREKHSNIGEMDYETYKLYKKRFDIITEQATVIVNELKAKGFDFGVGRHSDHLVIYIDKGSDMRSYFVAKNFVRFFNKLQGMFVDARYDIVFGFMRKWSLVGLAMLFQLISNMKDLEDKIHGAKFIDTYDPSSIHTTTALPDSEKPLFITYNGDVILTKASNLDSDHEYLVKYIEINGVKVALSYTLDHSVVFRKRVSGYLTNGEMIKYGHARLYCTKCGVTTFSIPVEEHVPVSIISVDGEMYYIRRDRLSVPRSVKDNSSKYHDYLDTELDKIERSPDLSPEVEYVNLGSGIYAPKGYIPDDVIEKLSRVDDFIMRAGILTEELKKRGFKFFINDSYWETQVRIIGPDEYLSKDHVEYSMYEYRYKYCCKWGLLGYAIMAGTLYYHNPNTILKHGQQNY